MDFQKVLPWQQVADHLRPLAKSRSGVEGAAYGIVYGFAAAMVSARKIDSVDAVKPLMVGAAMGLVFGAMDETSLPRYTDQQS